MERKKMRDVNVERERERRGMTVKDSKRKKERVWRERGK
jgi:hypothetical protein